jgi:membrane protease YdiL (CAAX protease family)
MPTNDTLRPRRRYPLWLLALVAAASIASLLFVNGVFFPSGLGNRAERATGGLVNATLLGSWIVFAVVVLGVLRGRGRVPWSRLGVRPADLQRALVATVALWVLVHLGLVLCRLLTLSELRVDPAWTEAGPLPLAGSLLAQVLGNAAVEEIVYRGFWVGALHQRFAACSQRAAPAASLLLAALLFALSHLPNRVFVHDATDFAELAGDQAMLFTVGLVFGWLWWRTRNLWFCIGVHALLNAPTLALDARGLGVWPQSLVVVGALVLAMRWPRASPFAER